VGPRACPDPLERPDSGTHPALNKIGTAVSSVRLASHRFNISGLYFNSLKYR
jgi:hypothetical protein